MIRTGIELAEVCTTLRQGGVAALDTEFVWRNTYRPMLALVQLGAADGTSWVEDCLKGFSAQPLAELLEDPGTVKVLHDAHQDLEHLHNYSGGTPVNVFDNEFLIVIIGFVKPAPIYWYDCGTPQKEKCPKTLEIQGFRALLFSFPLNSSGRLGCYIHAYSVDALDFFSKITHRSDKIHCSANHTCDTDTCKADTCYTYLLP